MILLAFIGLVTVLTWVHDTIPTLTSGGKGKEDPPAIAFEKRFVTYYKNSAGYGNELRLDLQTGCLYIDNGGSLSILFRNATEADCSPAYLEEYHTRG
ncbi:MULTISPECIES: hypothetical protein [Paenibacillus]|uniref:hypothetical protein n=1 Tax=Paenibacillus TaxID=44249 RepID=UPI0022B91132|nr:hypothetical protein [Paenibacillus caseinilyticus]MCZ8521663.1 hypothetical protein [Paenibacillus caseinilyticus]